jgi:hypothetical protein
VTPNSRFVCQGVDRVDNTKGYTLANSVPCCKVCNRMKMAMTKDDFLTHIRKVHSHFGL